MYDQNKTKEIKRKQSEISVQIKLCRSSINQNEVFLRNEKRKKIQLEKELQLRLAEIDKSIRRHAESLNMWHERLDEYISIKEKLHNELKAVIHQDEIQCEWCGRYYTQKGIKRHKEACASKPERVEIDASKKDLEKEKAKKEELERKRRELEKELKELDKIGGE